MMPFKSIPAVIAAALALIGGIFCVQAWMKRSHQTSPPETAAAQPEFPAATPAPATPAPAPQAPEPKFDPALIESRLRESSERKLAGDLKAAESEAKTDARQRLLTAAQTAHQARIARIDDLTAGFATGGGEGNATGEWKEMTRILGDASEAGGMDSALRYIEGRRASLLERAASVDAAHPEERRVLLQPLLHAANLLTAQGQTAAACAGYQDLLKLDPHWPQAIEGYAWALRDQSFHFLNAGPLTNAVADARQSLVHAQQFHELDPALPRAQRVLSAAHLQMADVLVQRDAREDADESLRHYEQSVAFDEALAKARPDSTQAARDASVSLKKLGESLRRRGRPGDADAALTHCIRSVELREKLMSGSPESSQISRDYIIALDLVAQIASEKGDSGKAMEYFTKANATMQKLLAANPDSAQAVRDVVVSHYKLAAYCTKQGDKAGEERHSRACYELLHARIAQDTAFDPPILRLHERLHARFGAK